MRGELYDQAVEHRSGGTGIPRKDGYVDLELWEQSVPAAVTGDSLWKMRGYRLALFASDIGWQDATRLAQDKRTVVLASQLCRALGSISANIAEGYSRSSPRDRVRFYEYALGSARETRDWYYKARHVLGQDIIDHRLSLLSEIIRLLLKMIPNQRESAAVKEETATYFTDDDILGD